MKRLLNVLGALVSDLTQTELAARGACRCHKFRSGGFGMELHTYGQALWNAKNITGSACVAVSRNWIWDPDETLFDLPRDKYCSKHLVSWKGKHGPKGWGVDKRLRRGRRPTARGDRRADQKLTPSTPRAPSTRRRLDGARGVDGVSF